MIRLGSKGAAALSGLLLTLILSGAATRPFSRNQKAFYADPKLVAFVRPGLTIKITSAGDRPGWDDHCGLFAHRPARSAPGSHRSIDARRDLAQLHRRLHPGRPATVCRLHHPERDRRRLRNGDAGGRRDRTAFSPLSGDGYHYTFATRAPSGFNPATTHTIGIYGSRDLTEFDLGTNYASATFNFVPNGSPGHGDA